MNSDALAEKRYIVVEFTASFWASTGGRKIMYLKPCLLTAFFVFFAMMPGAWSKDLRTEMEEANATFLTAYNSLNGSAFPAMYTKDAIVLPPGAQPVIGPEAIGQFWTDRIKGGTRKNHTFEIVSVERDGKYVYQVARWTLDLVKENSETTKLAGNTVRIFEQQPDGSWLTKVHIFNNY